MDKIPLVSIGLVTWNSSRHLTACLAALGQQIHESLETIVVDNSSTDESLATVTAHLPGARIIRNATNEGFCRAHNQAIHLTQGSYYLALNPDVVMQPGYVAALVSALEESPQYGSAGGKLWLPREGDEPVRIDSTGLFLDRRRRQYLRGHGEADRGQYDQAGEVFGVDGAAPLYRRTMLDDAQVDREFFDESFFAHKEDVDLAWRARLLGWRSMYVPEATAYHQRSFRPGRRTPMAPSIRIDAIKNRYLLLLKNESRLGWRRDGPRIAWYDLRILAYLCLFERTSLAAFARLRRQWARALEWRRQIWQRARVEPQQMLEWFR